MQQKLIEQQGESKKSTITVGGFNTPLSVADRSSSRTSVELNGTMNQLDLTDINRILHPTAAKYILFKLAFNVYQDRLHSESLNTP